MTQVHTPTEQKQTHRRTEQICGSQGGREVGEDGLGICDLQMQTITYRMDKQQGLTVYITQGTIFNIL